MASDQLAAHLSDVIEAIRCLNKSLFILDMAGLSVAAIHVDAALGNVHSELTSLPRIITDLDKLSHLDFSTMDAMAIKLFASP
jgi:hypothetical protein